MHRFIAHIGSFPIRSYSIIFVSAIIFGFGITITIAKFRKRNDLAEHIMNLFVPLVIGSIIGSRFWEVFFFQWGYYSQHLGEIYKIWHGGLSIQGGIVGALIVTIWYVRKHQLLFWELADLCAPGLILAQSIGRDANFMNGDAFGSPTHSGFGLLYPKDTNAYAMYHGQPLWPAEVWEGQMDVVIFAVIFIMMQRKLRRGTLFLTVMILYSIGRFCLEMLRGDTPDYLFGWTTAQWTAVATILISVLSWLYLRIISAESVVIVDEDGQSAQEDAASVAGNEPPEEDER